MNKENPKKNKKSFEYYIAQRKEEFRCQYDHERSWENLQYKLQKRKNHRLSLYCVAASAAFRATFSFSFASRIILGCTSVSCMINALIAIAASSKTYPPTNICIYKNAMQTIKKNDEIN